jgi:transcriptional regulator with XRE-family HTH domain
MKNSIKLNAKMLKSKRVLLGITQTDMADYLNMHQTTYSKFETGKPIIKLETIYKIAALLNTTPEDLLLIDNMALLANNKDKEFANVLYDELEHLIKAIEELKDKLGRYK